MNVQAATNVNRVPIDDWMVEQANAIARETVWDKNGDQSASQLSRAMKVALAAPTRRVLEHWIRYQWARETSQDLWQKRSGNSTIAQRVISVLNQLPQKLQSDPRATTVTEAEVMQAAARFFGYLRRSIIAAAKGKLAPGEV
ncbi:MAG: hypothetical protein IMX00_08735 [Limnochordales bacterium]|nr:hypothetical protein [Limnochordales bacterium]